MGGGAAGGREEGRGGMGRGGEERRGGRGKEERRGGGGAEEQRGGGRVRGAEGRGGEREEGGRSTGEGRRDDVLVSGAPQKGINSTDLRQFSEVLVDVLVDVDFGGDRRAADRARRAGILARAITQHIYNQGFNHTPPPPCLPTPQSHAHAAGDDVFRGKQGKGRGWALCLFAEVAPLAGP